MKARTNAESDLLRRLTEADAETLLTTINQRNAAVTECDALRAELAKHRAAEGQE